MILRSAFKALPLILIGVVVVGGIFFIRNTSKGYSALFDDTPVRWEIKVDDRISKDKVTAMGGETHVKDVILSKLSSKLAGKKVSATVTVSTKNNDKIFTTQLKASTSLRDMNKIIHSDLAQEINLIGGPAEIVIDGKVVKDQSVPVTLEINPSTGYAWDLVDGSGGKVTEEKSTIYKSKGAVKKDMVGMPMHQVVYLKMGEAGQVSTHLVYRRDWEGALEITRHLNVSMGDVPSMLDLSDASYRDLINVKGISKIRSLPDLFINWLRNLITGIELRDVKGTSDVVLPSSFDWRTQAVLPSVRNQGGCGSCWAFSGIGALESAMVIQGKMPAPDLSEQYLVSCNTDGSSCSGGFMSYVHRYSIDRLGKLQAVPGAVVEADFPYVATNAACIADLNHPYKAVSWGYIGADLGHPTVDEIKRAIYNHGPVSVTLCVGPAFSAYRGEVFTVDESSVCPNGINHAVVLVGWDDANQAWILRNSWGSTWGDGTGHMLIRYGISYVGSLGTYIDYIALTPTPVPTVTPTPTPSTLDTTPPTVAVTSPTSGAILSKGTSVSITATAQDNAGGVGMQKVEFYVNNALKCTSTTSPYSCNWKFTGKSGQQVNIEARAYDKASNKASSKITVISK